VQPAFCYEIPERPVREQLEVDDRRDPEDDERDQVRHEYADRDAATEIEPRVMAPPASISPDGTRRTSIRTGDVGPKTIESTGYGSFGRIASFVSHDSGPFPASLVPGRLCFSS